MNRSAQVQSVQAIGDFKAALSQFVEDARAGLSAGESEVHKTLSWLQYDRMTHWKRRVRQLEKELNEARVNLYRKQLGPVDQQQPHREEQEIYNRLKRHLEQAHEKIKVVKRWVRVLERESHIYKGQVQQLGLILETSFPRAQAQLDRIMQQIESYLSLQAPSIEQDTSSLSELDDDLEEEGETNRDDAKGDTP